MRNSLLSHRSGEMVSKDLEWTTFETVTGFTDANCLNVVGDGKSGGTTARSATTTGRSSSPRRWGTTTSAAATTGCGRGTRRHCGLGGWWVFVAGEQTGREEEDVGGRR